MYTVAFALMNNLFFAVHYDMILCVGFWLI